MKSRRILSFLLALMLLVFTGCSQEEAPATEPTQQVQQEQRQIVVSNEQEKEKLESLLKSDL